MNTVFAATGRLTEKNLGTVAAAVLFARLDKYER
jgi:hypothetical protein